MLTSISVQSPSKPTSPESLLRKVYGLKLRLYVRRRGLAKAITFQGALAHLRRETYAEWGQRTPEAVTMALDVFVKDRAVAHMAKAEELFGAFGAALAKRMQRARNRVKVFLPVGAI